MKSFLASIAFCTRIPILMNFSSEDVGKAARWFPLVGALLGAVSIAISCGSRRFFPPLVVAGLILLVETVLTGGLHMDGLADTADGFGGGKTRDDTLRIMRDHAIGSYGALALILLFLLKAAAISALVERNMFSPLLVLAPTLGRWNVVLLSRWLPYARTNEAVSRHIGTAELIWATLITACVVMGWDRWQGVACWGAAAIAAVLFGNFCVHKIGGVTGDTLGASEQISESVVLLLGIALR